MLLKENVKVIDQFMKHRWMEDNLETILNHISLEPTSFYTPIMMHIHLIMRLHLWPYIILMTVGSIT